MKSQAEYIIKRYGLSARFILELALKKWEKEGFQYPFNRYNQDAQEVMQDAVQEWFNQMTENRCRLLSNTSYANLYCRK